MADFYILKSERNGRYYIGSCIDKDKRLIKHNAGEVRSTKAYKPWKTIYSERYKTVSEAKKREYQVKSWKSRKSIEKLILGPIPGRH